MTRIQPVINTVFQEEMGLKGCTFLRYSALSGCSQVGGGVRFTTGGTVTLGWWEAEQVGSASAANRVAAHPWPRLPARPTAQTHTKRTRYGTMQWTSWSEWQRGEGGSAAGSAACPLLSWAGRQLAPTLLHALTSSPAAPSLKPAWRSLHLRHSLVGARRRPGGVWVSGAGARPRSPVSPWRCPAACMHY